MNKKGKSWPLFVVAILIVVFSLTAIFGVSYQYGDTKNIYIKGASDIRFGIDIRGGVDVTFMPAGDVDATPEQMTAAKTVIEDRLVGLGITDYESYVDSNKDRIIVRFPWKTGEADFNPQTAIDEIGTTAKMVFRKGSTADGEEILSGDDVTSANAAYNETEGWVTLIRTALPRWPTRSIPAHCLSPCLPRATPLSARPWALRAWRSWFWPASSLLRSSL